MANFFENPFVRYVLKKGCVKVRVDIIGGFPVKILDKGKLFISRLQNDDFLKEKTFFLREIVLAEDYPEIALKLSNLSGDNDSLALEKKTNISKFSKLSKFSKKLSKLHFRMTYKEENYWVLFSYERFTGKNGLPYFIGSLVDVSEYLGKEPVKTQILELQDTIFQKDFSEQKNDKVTFPADSKDFFDSDNLGNINQGYKHAGVSMPSDKEEYFDEYSLLEILGEDILLKLQEPISAFKNVYTAIFDYTGKKLASPNWRGNINEMYAFKYTKRFPIKLSRAVAGYFMIASSNSEIAKSYEIVNSQLSLATSLANSFLLLWKEMKNSENAGKILSANIELQVIVNSIYSEILKHDDGGDALISISKILVEGFNIDKIVIAENNDLKKHYDVFFEWNAPGKDIESIGFSNYDIENIDYESPLSYAALSYTREYLKYSDSYVSVSNVHELATFGVKSFAAYSCGSQLNSSDSKDRAKFVGIILFLRYNKNNVWKDTSFNVDENKALFAISQIMSLLSVRHKLDTISNNLGKELRKLAFTDSSLNIPNQNKFLKDVNKLFKNNQEGTLISLKITNVGDFDKFGKSYSELLLKSVIKFLISLDIFSEKDDDNDSESIFPVKKTIYKYTDSIINILINSVNKEKLSEFAEKIKLRFDRVWHINGGKHYLDLAVGIILFPENAINTEELLRCAFLTVSKSLKKSNNHFEFYNSSFDKVASNDYYYIQSLRQSIDNNMSGFFLLYQPIIDVETGKIIMCEVYTYFENYNDNLSSKKLIPILEEAGLDYELDVWCAKNACEFCRYIRENYEPDFKININLTKREILTGSALSIIKNALELSGIPGNCLCIDLPDSIFKIYDNNKISENILKLIIELKKLGVILIADGFGNDNILAPRILKNLKIDWVKTDYNLFSDIFDKTDEILLNALLEIAKTTKYGITVKRIEHFEHLENVKKYGVNTVEGFYISKPLSREEITENFIKGNIQKSLI